MYHTGPPFKRVTPHFEIAVRLDCLFLPPAVIILKDVSRVALPSTRCCGVDRLPMRLIFCTSLIQFHCVKVRFTQKSHRSNKRTVSPPLWVERNGETCGFEADQLLRSCDIVRRHRTHVIKGNEIHWCGGPVSTPPGEARTGRCKHPPAAHVLHIKHLSLQESRLWNSAFYLFFFYYYLFIHFACDVLCHVSVMEGGWMREDDALSGERSWLDGAVQERAVLKSCGLPANWAQRAPLSPAPPPTPLHTAGCRGIGRGLETRLVDLLSSSNIREEILLLLFFCLFFKNHIIPFKAEKICFSNVSWNQTV